MGCPVLRNDNEKCKRVVEELTAKLKELKIPIVDHKSVDADCLEKEGKYKGLHLIPKGTGRMAINFISHNRKN